VADAFERALEALSHRERTTAEIAEWLEARGFARTEVETALNRLIEAGAVDDENFARRYAEDKRELRGWGPDRIREALARRGLERELIDAAVAGDGHGTQLERAIELLERRGDALVDERSRSRALAFLARRGYDVDLAYEAVRGVERRAA
jgi:regulatory protein